MFELIGGLRRVNAGIYVFAPELGISVVRYSVEEGYERCVLKALTGLEYWHSHDDEVRIPDTPYRTRRRLTDD